MVAGAGEARSLTLCAFCSVVLVCPVLPVARLVNDPCNSFNSPTSTASCHSSASHKLDLLERERGLFCDNAVLCKFPRVIRAHQILNNDTFLKLTPVFE